MTSIGAFEHEVPGGLEAPVTELTEVAVWPASALQPIRAPNSIMEKKPPEDLAFGRSPDFPNAAWRQRTNMTRELDVVCGLRGIDPIG